ncbi:hypothetical protein WDA48_07840, partial [Acinetobacter pittii]
MKKLMLALAPVVLALTACATTTGTGTGAASAQTTTQQLGVAALKVAVNAKCITEINNVAAWKTATKYMTAEQRDSIQTALLHKDLKGKAPLIEPNLRRNLGKW